MTVSLRMTLFGAVLKGSLSPAELSSFYQLCSSLMYFAETHRNLLVGHDGIHKMKECLLQYYYWPVMDADIAAHLKYCHHCQMRRKDNCQPPALLSSLPQLTKPNQQVNADIFGPLKTSDSGEKVYFVYDECSHKICQIGAPA